MRVLIPDYFDTFKKYILFQFFSFFFTDVMAGTYKRLKFNVREIDDDSVQTQWLPLTKIGNMNTSPLPTWKWNRR